MIRHMPAPANGRGVGLQILRYPAHPVADRAVEELARFLRVEVDLDALAQRVFAGDTLAGAAFFVESVISVIVGLLCGGSGMALIAEGPVGIAIGIISSLLLFTVGRLLGKEAVDQKIAQMNLPLFIRRAALSEILPKLETPKLRLPNPLKPGESAEKPRLQLLPKLRWPEAGDIPARRMRVIRRKVKAGYEELLADENDEAVRTLNNRMCREITEQIEARLKELAEQVEIPL